MTPNEYQKLAKRTQCPQDVAIGRLSALDLEQDVAILHASVGISGEAGEISAAIERWLWYGKGLDRVNLKEELGDLFWYAAEMCNALSISMEDVMECNIAKLRQRYPEKYSDERAAEENRDREKEREILAAIGPSPKFEPFNADAEYWNANRPLYAACPKEHRGGDLSSAVLRAFREGWKLAAGQHPKYLVLELPGDVSAGWGTEWFPVLIASHPDGTGHAQQVYVPNWLPHRLEELEKERSESIGRAVAVFGPVRSEEEEQQAALLGAHLLRQNGNGFAEPPEQDESVPPPIQYFQRCAVAADGPVDTDPLLCRGDAINSLREEATRLGLSFMRCNNWTEVFNEIREERTKRNE